MTTDEFVKKVAANIGIISDDPDVLAQVGIRALGVIGYINGGGGNVTIETITDYELLCVSLGTADILVQKLPQYSPGFMAMAMQLQLGGGKNG